MTALSPAGVSSAAAPRGCRAGLVRTGTAVPAMLGSLLLLVVLFGWLGRWEAPVLLAWLASGVIVATRAGERVAVRTGCGFRRPSTAQAAALAPLWAAALRQTGIAAGDVDLYVQHSRQANAYAAGGRSVAVTAGVLDAYAAHRLTGEEFVAVLVHELGHHATRATRYALVSMWLAMPWRLAARLVIAVALGLSGRQPRPSLAVVVCAGVGVAVVQAVSRRNWLVAGVLAGVAVLMVLCPLVDAAASRRAEFVADQFAAHRGLAVPLAAALRTLDGQRSASDGWLPRILASHPAVDQRIDALHVPRRSSRPDDHGMASHVWISAVAAD